MTTPTPPRRVEVLAPRGDWPEISAGDDLAGHFVAGELRDGDVVVVTSKVVSKAEGRMTRAERADLVTRDTERVVARRGATTIARTHHGFVLAAAGVDASNVDPGTSLSLPIDPDRSAGRLRTSVRDLCGVNVAVVVSDTAGRAWRHGQTDIAVGCAGLVPLQSLVGTTDPYGNPLAVTAAAVADELAAAADLVKGKTTGRPVAIVRGWSAAVLPADDDGPGATALIRGADEDLFGLGARDAVLAAVTRDPVLRAGMPAPSEGDADPFDAVAATVTDHDVDVTVERLGPELVRTDGWQVRVDVRLDAAEDVLVEAGRVLERVDLLAAAHRLERRQVTTPSRSRPGWRTVAESWWIVA